MLKGASERVFLETTSTPVDVSCTGTVKCVILHYRAGLCTALQAPVQCSADPDFNGLSYLIDLKSDIKITPLCGELSKHYLNTVKADVLKARAACYIALFHFPHLCRLFAGLIGKRLLFLFV